MHRRATNARSSPRWSCWLGLALLTATGCTTWSLPGAATAGKQMLTKGLPSLRGANDSVALEVATIHLSNTPDDQREAEIWKLIDEQAVSAEVRRRLAASGFRAGVIAGEIPANLRSHFKDQAAQEETVVDQPRESSESPTGGKLIQNRPGHRSKVVVSETRDQLIVLQTDGGRLTGQTYHQAQCLFSLRGYPSGDGRLRLELTPEIEHGQPKQRWVGQSHDGTFRIDTSRERVEFTSLTLDMILAPGQTLVLSTGEERKGLARQFFSETASGKLEQRLLLIRAASTQFDNLFAPSLDAEPLATPLD